MPIFRYTATDYSGQKIKGSLKAKDRESVVNSLRKGHLVIINVNEISEKQAGSFQRKGKVKTEDLVVFSRQLATLVKSGIPLVRGLNILFGQVENRYFKEVISALATDIESGQSLSDALAAHNDVFPALYINMVRAGELSGTLDVILERLSLYLESSLRLVKKVRSAFIYPVVVIVIAIGITAVIFLKVIPSFKSMFETLGADLPLATKLVIKTSEILQHSAWIVVLIAAALFFIAKQLLRRPSVHMALDRIKLRVPVFGSIIRKFVIARFSRTLATLLKSGVSIVSALDTAAKTSGNKLVEVTIDRLRDQVSKGEKIGDTLAQSAIFTPLAVNLIAIGEETGDLPAILEKVAVFYEDDVDNAVGTLTSLLEPFIILFLGGMVGGIVLSMFLPILQIMRYVGR